MSTVLRDEGFEVRIYTLDHPPPHVHVAKAGAIVRVDLSRRMWLPRSLARFPTGM